MIKRNNKLDLTKDIKKDAIPQSKVQKAPFEEAKVTKNTVKPVIKIDESIKLPTKATKPAKSKKRLKLVKVNKTKVIKKKIDLNKSKSSVKEVKSSIPTKLSCKLVLSGISKQSIDEYIKLISKTINQSSLRAV